VVPPSGAAVAVTECRSVCYPEVKLRRFVPGSEVTYCSGSSHSDRVAREGHQAQEPMHPDQIIGVLAGLRPCDRTSWGQP
jgi:hypothetical protein